MVLMLKMYTISSTTTVKDCAAVLGGPFIEGQNSPRDINHLEGNETSPVVIRCQIKCLNYTDTHHSYNPALGLVVTELGIFKNIPNQQHGYDTDDELYQNITYTHSAYCAQSNNYMMQYSFAIYPTLKMDKTVARCGVSFLRNRKPCWGEPVVFIRYVNTSMTDHLTPTVCMPPSTSDSMINDSPIFDERIDSDNNSTTTSISSPDPTTYPTSSATNYQQIVISAIILGVLLVLLVMTIALVVILYSVCFRSKKVARDAENGVVNPNQLHETAIYY